MPLYEYQCEACGHRFETIRKFSDSPLEACPKCGGAVHKLQSAPAFQFKGTGWYITDYAKKDSGGKPGQTTPTSEKSDTASSGSSSETKTDSSKSDAGSSSSTPAAKIGSDAKGS